MATQVHTDAMQRADELLRQMTIEEKAMQLSSVFPVALFGPDGPIPDQLDEHLKHGIGHIAALGLIGHKTPEQLAKSVNAIQHYLVTETRLKIPAIFHNEVSCPSAARSRRSPSSDRMPTMWRPASRPTCTPPR